jgi:hypothetical protein
VKWYAEDVEVVVAVVGHYIEEVEEAGVSV